MHPASDTAKGRWLWLGMSLLVAASYGVIALREGFSSEYIVQDDARQHVFWMQRFIDPGLFPDDLIADYFQSISPTSYGLLYRLFATAGVEPLAFNKILPLVLGLFTASYAYYLALSLFRVPVAAFAATVLLNQSLWLADNLASGTPRGFAAPLLLAFLYYLVVKSLRGTAVVLGMQGLVYPPVLLLSMGLLLARTVRWRRWHPEWASTRDDFRLLTAGLIVGLLVLLPYALPRSQFGPMVSGAQARSMAEFHEDGRTAFFGEDRMTFWLLDGRSGFFPGAAANNPLIWVAVALPFLLRRPDRFPLAKRTGSGVTILPQLLVVAVLLFGAAHLTLFRLYLPSRYTHDSLRIVMSLAAGAVFALLIDRFGSRPGPDGTTSKRRHNLRLLLVAVPVGIALLLFPAVSREVIGDRFPNTGYMTGEQPALYRFFARMPKDIVVASLSHEADMIPSFSKRSVLVAYECAIPYHLGYYSRFRERVVHLIGALYTPDLAELREFLQRYDVDFVMIDKGGWEPPDVWRSVFRSELDEAMSLLEQQRLPAWTLFRDRCASFETDRTLVLDGSCLRGAGEPPR